MGSKISGKDLIKLGFPQNNTINIGLNQIQRYRKREKKEAVLQELSAVLSNPNIFQHHGIWGKLAEGLIKPVEVKMQELLNSALHFRFLEKM